MRGVQKVRTSLPCHDTLPLFLFFIMFFIVNLLLYNVAAQPFKNVCSFPVQSGLLLHKMIMLHLLFL